MCVTDFSKYKKVRVRQSKEKVWKALIDTDSFMKVNRPFESKNFTVKSAKTKKYKGENGKPGVCYRLEHSNPTHTEEQYEVTEVDFLNLVLTINTRVYVRGKLKENKGGVERFFVKQFGSDPNQSLVHWERTFKDNAPLSWARIISSFVVIMLLFVTSYMSYISDNAELVFILFVFLHEEYVFGPPKKYKDNIKKYFETYNEQEMP
eukprot:snap_masked-scaffold_80-processed-gene-0.24-mRNA-1 protein AED:1.00 eAED:1.00 QI:0/0/0/0/1/1/2/0/205